MLGANVSAVTVDVAEPLYGTQRDSSRRRCSIARRRSPNDPGSHCANVRRSNASSSSGPIVATGFTHSATVSGGAGPIPIVSSEVVAPRRLS